MSYKSIVDLLEKVDLNAKAAECLGLAGAFTSLPEELNEIEAAEHARNLLEFVRETKKREDKISKIAEQNEKRKKSFKEKVKLRQEKIDQKNQKFEERLNIFNERLEKVQEENKVRAANGKRLLKEPSKPAPPKYPKMIDQPKLEELPPPPKEPLLPRKVLSQRERIRLQRQMLNAYISGHPLDEVPADDKITKINQLENLYNKDFVQIRGVLQSVKVISTRSKKLMAKLRIEDKNGSIEVAVFPRVYEVAQGTLEEGELYKVTGRLDRSSIYDVESDEDRTHVQIIGTKISRMQIMGDKEWEIRYPLLKGIMRILPGIIQKSKGVASSIIMRIPREQTEEKIG